MIPLKKKVITTAVSRDVDWSWQPALACHTAAVFLNRRKLYTVSYVYGKK